MWFYTKKLLQGTPKLKYGSEFFHFWNWFHSLCRGGCQPIPYHELGYWNMNQEETNWFSNMEMSYRVNSPILRRGPLHLHRHSVCIKNTELKCGWRFCFSFARNSVFVWISIFCSLFPFLISAELYFLHENNFLCQSTYVLHDHQTQNQAMNLNVDNISYVKNKKLLGCILPRQPLDSIVMNHFSP